MWWLIPFLGGMFFFQLLRLSCSVFEFIKDLYATDQDFKDIFRKCSKTPSRKYYQMSGILLFDNRLCMPPMFFDGFVCQGSTWRRPDGTFLNQKDTQGGS